MEIYEGVGQMPAPIEGAALTVGNFDGLHVGHRTLVSRAVREAQERGVQSVVMTFHPHPAQVLFPEKGLKRLFDLQDMKAILRELGVDVLILEPFSREFSQLSAERFVNEWLYRPFTPQVVVVGYDFGFGANRTGSIDYLEASAKKLGFELQVVEPVKIEGHLASSSRIRQAIQSGHVALAHTLLTRPYYIKGVVERGDGRGQKIGFPTANLHSFSEIVPEVGVYITKLVDLEKEEEWPSVTNIGFHPTFEKATKLKIETHILEGSEHDLYGRSLRVYFFKRIRGELKFQSKQELLDQISKDIATAKGFFS